MDQTLLSRSIKEKAYELGFLACGFSRAEFLESEVNRLDSFLKNGFQGKMSYLERNFDKRLDPRVLHPGTRTVISVLQNYYPANQLNFQNGLKISKYAYGEDYHDVLKDKLHALADFIKTQVGTISYRVFTDSAPVLEKAWAQRSGLGWIGKNGNLLTAKVGSFYFLGELFVDLDLDYDAPVTEHCGSCTRCIDACPTEAIVKPYVVDGSKCISYLTIELRDELIPSSFTARMENWVYGCDICQDVCPWNRFSSPTKEPRFEPGESLKNINFRELSAEGFKRIFQNSAIKRIKYEGLIRNLRFVGEQE